MVLAERPMKKFLISHWSVSIRLLLVKLVGFFVQLLLVNLSNDPGKNCTIFYCSDATSFPHIETVVFLGQEFLN